MFWSCLHLFLPVNPPQCDKLRPSCSLCQHSKTECQYDTFQAYDSSAPHKRRKRKKNDADEASTDPKDSKRNKTTHIVINKPSISSTGAPIAQAGGSTAPQPAPPPYGGSQLQFSVQPPPMSAPKMESPIHQQQQQQHYHPHHHQQPQPVDSKLSPPPQHQFKSFTFQITTPESAYNSIAGPNAGSSESSAAMQKPQQHQQHQFGPPGPAVPYTTLPTPGAPSPPNSSGLSSLSSSLSGPSSHPQQHQQQQHQQQQHHQQQHQQQHHHHQQLNHPPTSIPSLPFSNNAGNYKNAEPHESAVSGQSYHANQNIPYQQQQHLPHSIPFISDHQSLPPLKPSTSFDDLSRYATAASFPEIAPSPSAFQNYNYYEPPLDPTAKSPTLSVAGLLSDIPDTKPVEMQLQGIPNSNLPHPHHAALPMMSFSSLLRMADAETASQPPPVANRITMLDEDDEENNGENCDRSLSVSSVSSFSSDGSDEGLQDASSSTTPFMTMVTKARDMSPSFSMDSFMDVKIPRSLKYLWYFYLQKTSRFCAIHDFETPFLSSIVPMASKNEALQQSLMQLSGIYRNKILGYNDTNYDRTMIKLNVKSVRGLRNQIVTASVSNAEALVGIATCLSLSCCAIGENNSESYNVHLYGALILVTQVLLPSPRFQSNADSWFLFKWTTYTLVLVNLNLLASPEHLLRAKAHNLPAMVKLYEWWVQNAPEDPEYSLPVDSFYGFGTQLAPVLLQFNILAYRKILCNYEGARPRIESVDSEESSSAAFGEDEILPVMEEEVRQLEAQMWFIHEHSVLSKYSSSEYTTMSTRKADIDLLHCNNAFHSAALLWLYTYLKPQDEFSRTQRIPHLVSTVLQEVKAINPECRTAAALLFVIYIVGSYAEGDQRSFIHAHLESMRTTCLSSVSAVLDAFEIIWRLRDQHKGAIDMTECHRRVHDAGINVCLY